MSFTKLNINNFTKTKITNKSFVKYDSSNLESLQKDFSLNSKNSVNTEFTISMDIVNKAIVKYNEYVDSHNATTSEFNSNLQDEVINRSLMIKISPESLSEDRLNAINNHINRLRDRKNTSLLDLNSDNFWDKLKSLKGVNDQEDLNDFSDIGLPLLFYKFVLSELLISNEFKIERVGQKFLPYSDELSKKNFIRDKLYKYYQNQISVTDYKNISYTFTNYNTINFHQIGNNKHSNAIVYPNPYSQTNEVHGYEFLDSNSFNISFWINKRQTNNENEAQCVLHIPYLLSLYTVDKSSTSYSFLVRCGEESNNYFNNDDVSSLLNEDNTDSLFDVNSNTPYNFGQYGNGKLLTNHWHNISINFIKSEDSIMVLFYIDGNFIGKNILNNTSSTNILDKNSFICFGNKPYYKDSTNPTLDSLYTQFFAKVKSVVNESLGPHFNKDISLGKLNDYNQNDLVDFDSINQKFVSFSTEAIETPNLPLDEQGFVQLPKGVVRGQQFEGEIHDIRIYKNSINESKIKDTYKNIINDIEKEINEFDLDFYVPVFYVATEVAKRSMVNLNSNEDSIPQNKNIPKLYYYKFNHMYNPILSNHCGGFELSVENYLIEFVKEVKPNVVINGNQKVLRTNTSTFYHGITDYSIFENVNDLGFTNNDFRKGENLFEVLWNSKPLRKNKNLKYYNSLILPNDNGIPVYSTNSLEYLIVNNSTLNINRNFYFLQQLWSKINLTSTQNLNDNELQQYFNTSTFLDYNDIRLVGDESMKIFKSDTVSHKATTDLVFDVSNHYYHDGILSDVIEDGQNVNDAMSIKNTFLDVYERQNSNSNPVTRDITSALTSSSDTDDVHLTFASYQKFNLPYYDINKEDCNFFNVYFDITNN